VTTLCWESTNSACLHLVASLQLIPGKKSGEINSFSRRRYDSVDTVQLDRLHFKKVLRFLFQQTFYKARMCKKQTSRFSNSTTVPLTTL